MDNKFFTFLQNFIPPPPCNHTIDHLTHSLTQLCYFTASVSHPIPLSAANRNLMFIGPCIILTDE
jgi:hypothetical protein